ncbi:hypothetical protein Pcinc_035997 [Petrolisthes cinctipes]|uniref:Uncharacterized protein n=1 Tax=Petrolisthes cinctipes TaxID=88211 RepID=A0AAE1BVD7_PETCI|nr:hypothetical protein Pcinc_035997 [Petrolisthes cinctipes]
MRSGGDGGGGGGGGGVSRSSNVMVMGVGGGYGGEGRGGTVGGVGGNGGLVGANGGVVVGSRVVGNTIGVKSRGGEIGVGSRGGEIGGGRGGEIGGGRVEGKVIGGGGVGVGGRVRVLGNAPYSSLPYYYYTNPSQSHLTPQQHHQQHQGSRGVPFQMVRMREWQDGGVRPFTSGQTTTQQQQQQQRISSEREDIGGLVVPSAAGGLSWGEAIQLTSLLQDPLQTQLLLQAVNRMNSERVDIGDIIGGFGGPVGGLGGPVGGPVGGYGGPVGGLGDNSWMSRVSEVMGGVSQQLPSIHKAVTTMSFIAFGVFITNLLVQALANSTSLESFIGREETEVGHILHPLSFSLMEEEGEGWMEEREGGEGEGWIEEREGGEGWMEEREGGEGWMEEEREGGEGLMERGGDGGLMERGEEGLMEREGGGGGWMERRGGGGLMEEKDNNEGRKKENEEREGWRKENEEREGWKEENGEREGWKEENGEREGWREEKEEIDGEREGWRKEMEEIDGEREGWRKENGEREGWRKEKEEIDGEREGWKEDEDEKDNNETVNKDEYIEQERSHRLQLLSDVIGDVYLQLHNRARQGVVGAVARLGLTGGGRGRGGGLDVEGECGRRVLCHAHRANPTLPYLPYWTLGASWLSGDGNMPHLLENLRAEVGGQSGRPCAALYPSCPDTPDLLALLQEVEGMQTEAQQKEGEDTQDSRGL